MDDELAKQIQVTNTRFYEENGASFARTRSYTWNEERAIAPLIQHGMSVVDIGAGNGRFARILHDKQITYLGIEPSSALRQSADPSLDIRDGSLPHLPLSDNLADLTVCFAVLHHLPTEALRRTAVQELIRITKPGGIIVASAWYLAENTGNHTPIPHADPGDIWVPWHADHSDAQRYVHRMQPQEWEELWQHPMLHIDRIGLFGKTDWTEDTQEARNWFVITHRI